MSSTVQTNRRVLFHIIRAPTLSQSRLVPPLYTTTRSLSSSQPRPNDEASITFGRSVDRIIGIKAKRKPRQSNSGEKIWGARSRIPTSGDAGDTNGVEQPVMLELSSEFDVENIEPDYKPPRRISETSPPRKENNKLKGTKRIQTLNHSPPSQPPSPFTSMPSSKSAEIWRIQKEALKAKFAESGGAWEPRKRLSPDTLDGIRDLHQRDPVKYSTPVLADQFKVSPEAIRRILRSKWRPSPEEAEDRRERWARRHDRIWDNKAELGLRPPRVRDRQVEGPDEFEEKINAKRMLGEMP